MAIVQVPTRSDLPAYDMEIDLDEVTFTLAFEWSDRSQSWHMHIRDELGEDLLTGIRLVTGWPLLEKYQDPRLPAGELFCVDTGTDNKDPGFDDFGTRVLLMYEEADGD